ncbi:MAG: hypothetical protein ACRD9Y_28685 [Blastocatellia bacterium]
MWQRLFDLLKSFFTISEEVKKLQADSQEFSQQLRELAENQTRLYYEYQIQRERDARERERENFERERESKEREKELLRLENQLLRERLERLERLLPSATTDKNPDEK